MLYRPEVIAAASLLLACAQLDIPFPAEAPSLSEQKSLHDLAIQEAEEGEEPPAYEPVRGWKELLGVEASELAGASGFRLIPLDCTDASPLQMPHETCSAATSLRRTTLWLPKRRRYVRPFSRAAQCRSLTRPISATQLHPKVEQALANLAKSPSPAVDGERMDVDSPAS